MPLTVGGFVPWFSARNNNGDVAHIHLAAGKWVILVLTSVHYKDSLLGKYSWLGDLNASSWMSFIVTDQVIKHTDSIFLNVLSNVDSSEIEFLARSDPQIIVADPMLRIVACFRGEDSANQAQDYVTSLSGHDMSRFAANSAPILRLPYLLPKSYCQYLIELFDGNCAGTSECLMETNGIITGVTEPSLKSRKDIIIGPGPVFDFMSQKIHSIIWPAVERFLGGADVCMDRLLLSCYESAIGGRFVRHRDNVHITTSHRRFAVSIGLNEDFEGGEIFFPEFDRQGCKPSVGEAVIFSAGILHEVRPVLKGKRYVLLTFLVRQR
jgi:hypothetical protein